MEKRLAAGEKPETLDTWQIVSTPTGRQFRYAKALPVQQVCLTCHGDPASIPDGVKARLAAEYPLDKSTGYAPGMVRGIISIKRSLLISRIKICTDKTSVRRDFADYLGDWPNYRGGVKRAESSCRNAVG